jgi:hypothetical protein
MTQVLQQTQEFMPISVCRPASSTLFAVETARAMRTRKRCGGFGVTFNGLYRRKK